MNEFTAADDNFHFKQMGDRWWMTETSWFSFCNPQRKLGGWLYTMARPNIGTVNPAHQYSLGLRATGLCAVVPRCVGLVRSGLEVDDPTSAEEVFLNMPVRVRTWVRARCIRCDSDRER